MVQRGIRDSAFGTTCYNEGKITDKSLTGYTDTETTSWSRNYLRWIEGILTTCQ